MVEGIRWEEVEERKKEKRKRMGEKTEEEGLLEGQRRQARWPEGRSLLSKLGRREALRWLTTRQSLVWEGARVGPKINAEHNSREYNGKSPIHFAL